MKSKIIRIVLSLLTIGAAVAVAGAPTVAYADSSAVDREKFLVEQAFKGEISEGELAELKRDFPQTAESIPDLKSVKAAPPKIEVAHEVAKGSKGCRSIYGEVHFKSITGLTTLYRFRHEVNFCWNGSIVTSLDVRPHRMTDVDWSIEGWEVASESKSGVRTPIARSYKQLRVTHCLLYVGCFARTYPWVELTLMNEGSSREDKGV